MERLKKNCPFLTELTFNDITSKEVIELSKILENNNNLKKLNLFGNKINDGAKEILYKVVKRKNIELSFLKNFIIVFGENIVYNVLSPPR